MVLQLVVCACVRVCCEGAAVWVPDFGDPHGGEVAPFVGSCFGARPTVDGQNHSPGWESGMVQPP